MTVCHVLADMVCRCGRMLSGIFIYCIKNNWIMYWHEDCLWSLEK